MTLENGWWAVIEIPRQNRGEPISDFVLRVSCIVDCVRVPAAETAFRETNEEKELRAEKVNGCNHGNIGLEKAHLALSIQHSC